MKSRFSVYAIAFLFLVVSSLSMTAMVAKAGRGNAPTGVIYVTSQGLYYDTFVTVDPLPPKGKFQQLFPPGANPDYPDLEYASTEFHKGGRWWIDLNGNEAMDENDHYFLCPLLGPGRENP